MKLFTPEKTVLMDITAITPHPDGLLIEGKIMGTMPMKAVLRSNELQAGRRFLSWALVRRVIGMVFARQVAGSQTPTKR